MISKWFIYN